MVDEEVKRKVEQYIEVVRQKFDLRMALLFGSQVRGEAN